MDRVVPGARVIVTDDTVDLPQTMRAYGHRVRLEKIAGRIRSCFDELEPPVREVVERSAARPGDSPATETGGG